MHSPSKRALYRVVGIVGILTAGVIFSVASLAAQAPDKPRPRILDVNPKHFSKDATVKLDYDIVYVRAPRFVKGDDGKDRPAPVWPEIGHPFNLRASTDLMVLHPDGSEDLLVAGGKGAIADPSVSFDAQWVYYSHFHDISGSGGADVYKVHVKTREVVRLTQQQWTPNTGIADWAADFRTPAKGKTALSQGVYNIHPCPLPGGRVAFVSNRDGLKTPRGYPQRVLQLFVMDDDGANVEKIGHLNAACALHPVVLKDGRILFSSLESQGVRDPILWGIWSIHPDGTNWGPIVSAYSFSHGSPNAFHFQSQLSDSTIVVEEYYNQNTAGFGTFYTLPASPPNGVPAFGPAKEARDPSAPELPFRPFGIKDLTRFTHPSDSPAPLSDPKDPKSPRVGKVTHPCGAPDNHLLTVWSPGGTPAANGPGASPIHAGIYLIKDGQPVLEPGAMLLIKHDANYNAQWPRPLVSYKRIYGIDEPARLTHRNDGKLSKHLPEGTPFGLVGTSSLYKRESYPFGTVSKGSVTASGNPYAAFSMDLWLGINWSQQGADAGLYTNSDIHAIRVLAMEPPSIPVARKFFNHAQERLRILGEIPVRHFGKDGQPLDPDGNPDTSFLAKLPSDLAWTFQTLDKDGMVLNMSQTWHQVRPGEIRNDCGGCHAHSQKRTLFKDTAAAKADYQIFDLTKRTPLLVNKTVDQSGKKWDIKDETGLTYRDGPLNVEYYRDIKPIFERSCVACHSVNSAKPAGNLTLDDEKRGGADPNVSSISEVVPVSYRTLADTRSKSKRYVWPFQSRRSLLTWKVYGRRTDGLPELPADAKPDKVKYHLSYLAKGDFQGSAMPPLESVAGTYVGPDGNKIKVAALTDEDRRAIVRWIDLGCPIDLDFDPKEPQRLGHGWMLDDQRPTLTLTHPQAGANMKVDRILIGMHDYYSGLDEKSFKVVADFPFDGTPAGKSLASQFKVVNPGVWELKLNRPITELPKGKLTVTVQDLQGNVTRIERTFSVK